MGEHEIDGIEVDGIEVVHLRLRDGRCVISLNGQGHLPCSQHPRTAPAPVRAETNHAEEVGE